MNELNTIYVINQNSKMNIKAYFQHVKKMVFLKKNTYFFSVKYLETLKAHTFASSGFEISKLLQFRNSNKNSRILDFEVGSKCCSLPTD